MIISYQRAQRLLSRGCEVFLVDVIATIESRIEFVVIHIVCDVTDVFLDEVSGLPSAREVDFAIDLVSDITAIS